MPLRDVELDEPLTRDASELRRAEWETIIAELLDPVECVFVDDADVLAVARSSEGYALSLRRTAGDPLETCVTLADIGKTFDEYIDIVRKLGDASAGGGYDRVDALDMAKRVTHDQGGRVVLRACRPFDTDHPTARRIFTLLLSLHVDTTALDVRGHVDRRDADTATSRPD